MSKFEDGSKNNIDELDCDFQSHSSFKNLVKNQKEPHFLSKPSKISIFSTIYENDLGNLYNELIHNGEMIANNNDMKNKALKDIKEILENAHNNENCIESEIMERKMQFSKRGTTAQTPKNLVPALVPSNEKCSFDIVSKMSLKANSIEKNFYIGEEIQPIKREFDIKTNKKPSSEDLSSEPDNVYNDIEKMMEVQKRITYEKIIQVFFSLIKKESFENKIIFEKVLRQRSNYPYRLTG